MLAMTTPEIIRTFQKAKESLLDGRRLDVLSVLRDACGGEYIHSNVYDLFCRANNITFILQWQYEGTTGAPRLGLEDILKAFDHAITAASA